MNGWLIFITALKLGLTSFGGPVAHLGYFHEEYVKRRKWLDEKTYADLVALCQFLPGPASSQVGIAIGTMRGGLAGGILAWLGFTLPSVMILIAFAYFVETFHVQRAGWLTGLKLVAVPIVAQAVFEMGRKLTPDRLRITIAAAVASISLLFPSPQIQLVLLVLSGLIGFFLLQHNESNSSFIFQSQVSKRVGIASISLFFLFLFCLPLLRQFTEMKWIALFDSFYRGGSLVFGGGHVVLPLLEKEFVPIWLTHEQFLAGYGAAQAVPGPLFTFASYLGTVIDGWQGALLATVAIFLPSFFLVLGVLPFWNMLRQNKQIQSIFSGVNAGVVGILLAALYDPIWTTSIVSPLHFTIAFVCFVLLIFWKWPSWFVVIVSALLGGIFL
ncbi:chromate transporter [Anoxybacillus calidus]|uniref:Chromate transporter n=1 Tax=[Anoxybacillus] calidus TaxID=575178 RepID=A0A7V9YY58_9BACL|nr:chromate transporter [Anoxybacillus calidus]MBA2870618.1 chromate transporter [Anoxybacillus calidus]